MTAYDLARGLHILAVIAWMAGLLFLPRLYAYDAEQAAKPEPLRGEMQALLRTWQTRLLRIIVNPAMILAWGFGLWLIHLDTVARGAAFLLEPWMLTKLAGVLLLSGWHGFLAGQRRKIAAGASRYSSRFWRMTNEVPFLLAIVMVLSVTTEWRF
ncbi:CopD family protein [Brevundimonas sp. PAMC22021]|uniref:CopD family protein n=1 Tax=Brevundimonas sp. PAMC22021 TaxID=2861285 RepID=UPI001C6368F0|nr:CopD family protein [Brevundimonas sp. PAMC22021]QYF86721.1 CopD family protein [Brevundimonas sp. PAMC22021]